MIHTISPDFTVSSFDNAQTAFNHAGEALNQMLQKYRTKPLLFLSSGGSSMALLSAIKPNILNSDMTISVTDDRWNNDPKVNNFAQIMALPFYKQAQKQGCRFIDTRLRAKETVESTGQRFGTALKDWVTQHPEGKIVITQGVGPDRHTCGIMPFPEDSKTFQKLFQNNTAWAVGYDAKEKNEYPLRITLTMPFLKERVEQSIVYMGGENKKPALDAICVKKGDLSTTPARILREMKQVSLFTDIDV